MLKKIKVVESNNSLLDYRALDRYDFYEQDDELKKYVETFLDLSFENDVEMIIKVLYWVSNQWIHSGMNSPGDVSSFEILKRAHNGERFRCVEYGKVTSDILKSLGFVSRQISLRTPISAYGGTGQGHVATEVWSDSLKKWIFIDPQFSIYIKSNEDILSYYEIYCLIKQNNLKMNHINYDKKMLNIYNQTHEEYVENYLSFIQNYTGFINEKLTSSKKESSLSLLLDDEHDVLSFQGMPIDPYISTSKIEHFYINMNQTSVSFKFHNNVNMQKIISDNNIVDNESFIKNMEKFAAIPEYEVSCMHNSPYFDYFEYMIDKQPWVQVAGNTFNLKQNEGKTELKIRSVNKYMKKGLTTKIVLEFL